MQREILQFNQALYKNIFRKLSAFRNSLTLITLAVKISIFNKAVTFYLWKIQENIRDYQNFRNKKCVTTTRGQTPAS